MTSILLQFPPPPRRSLYTVFEQDGQMKDAPETLPIANLCDYPDIKIQGDLLGRSNLQCESAQMAFLSHGQGSWKQALHAWHNGGFIEMLRELSNSTNDVPTVISTVCRYGLSFFQHLVSLKTSVYPDSSLSSMDLVSKFAHVSNWTKSPVLALAWHPHIPKVALAQRDSSIIIYSQGNSLSPVLKHRLQKHVADLSWQPLSSSVLAVACHSCVLIWHVEPTSLAVRPSSSCVQILQSNGHSPIMSLVWTPRGDKLISSSPRQTSVVVWDVPKEHGINLRWDWGGGVPLLAHSPDGSKLFTGTLSPTFRIWETQRWSWEVWSELSGRCKTACWSPDGSVLIFAMEKDCALYAIRFSSDSPDNDNRFSAGRTSVLLADVSEVSVSIGSELDIRAGGEIHTIAWDQTGERLAVMFEPNELGHNHMIAVFKVTVHPVLELLPGGFVKGCSGETAHHIAFVPNFDKGALLSVVWSSGRIGYVPMYFTASQRIQLLQSNESRPWCSPPPKFSTRDWL